ncbi:DUF2231 domain-containing protein [Phenylobacterium terrae]|uniref:DUF2231 domain-containing protein n=1 Tax=Phenylobacterium terrae TaxID=2665495 RepID=A0ABW4N3E8_9CAUL
MNEHNPRSTAKVAGHPLHPMIVPFPIAFLVSALATDIGYLNTGSDGWATASMWMLGAGISMALLAAVLGLTDFLGDRKIRMHRAAWLHMVGNVIAVAVAAVNFYLRATGDAAAAIAPAGVTLSAAVVLILLFTGWMGWELVYRHRTGVSEEPDMASARVETRR